MSEAPIRHDLAFMRRRRRPSPAPVAPAPAPIAQTPAPAPAAPHLDLAPPAHVASPTTARRTPPPPALTGFVDVTAGATHHLVPEAPVVQLNRVQSGVGALDFTLHSPEPEVLGVLYEIDGVQGHLRGPNAQLAPSTRHPIVSLDGNTVHIDLGNARTLTRFAVLARTTHGALTIETSGGVRLDVPLGVAGGGDDAANSSNGVVPGRVHVVLTGHRVRGCYVLRAEREAVDGGAHAAATAHGYNRLTWRDAETVVPTP